MRSSSQGSHVSGRVRELIALVNNTHVVSRMGFCMGLKGLRAPEAVIFPRRLQSFQDSCNGSAKTIAMQGRDG